MTRSQILFICLIQNLYLLDAKRVCYRVCYRYKKPIGKKIENTPFIVIVKMLQTVNLWPIWNKREKSTLYFHTHMRQNASFCWHAWKKIGRELKKAPYIVKAKMRQSDSLWHVCRKVRRKLEQKAHVPWHFADMMACHKRSSYYASSVQTGSSYLKSLLAESQMPTI